MSAHAMQTGPSAHSGPEQTCWTLGAYDLGLEGFRVFRSRSLRVFGNPLDHSRPARQRAQAAPLRVVMQSTPTSAWLQYWMGIQAHKQARPPQLANTVRHRPASTGWLASRHMEAGRQHSPLMGDGRLPCYRSRRLANTTSAKSWYDNGYASCRPGQTPWPAAAFSS